MNRSSLLFLASAASVALAGARAQDVPDPSRSPAAKTAGALAAPAAVSRELPAPAPIGGRTSARARDWQSPIHTLDADPAGGTYGWWAAGLSFKASFHDGFAFYPYLGPTYARNLPWKWRTVSVTAGGHELLPAGATPAHAHTALRYEYRYPSFVEAYDVRFADDSEAVEQTFTIAQRPAFAGDVVVRGRIDSELRAQPFEDAHRGITFHDGAGNALVSYGAAIAIDANGARTPVTTGFDGDTIRLTVPGAWLAEAAFPVTIDPLTARVTISTWGGTTFGLPSYPAIGRDDESTTMNVMTFYSRQFSASDFDGYARLTNNDYSGSVQIYTDVTASWSTVRAGVASVGGANRWTLCLQRDFGTPTNASAVRVYTHNFGNTTLNSGTTAFHTLPSTETHRYPEIGGTDGFSSGTNALLVYQADVTPNQQNTTASEAWGVLFNAATNTFGTRFLLAGFAVGTSRDREYPNVNQESSGGTAHWVVTWAEFNNTITNDDVDVAISRVSSTGTILLNASYIGSEATTDHKLFPRVAGREGRYLVTYLRSTSRTSGFGTALESERVNWTDTGASATELQIRTLTSGGTDVVQGGVAYNDVTDSHWAVVWQRGSFTTGNVYASRLGYTGGTVETHTVYSAASTGGYSPNITFDDDGNQFMLVHASNENPPSGYPVFGYRLTFAAATNLAYGTSCGGTISASRVPNAGDEFYNVNLGAATPNSPAALLISSGSANIGLGFMGLGTCVLNVNLGAPFVVVLNSNTNAAGNASLNLKLNDSPAIIGDLYMQWAYAAPGTPWPTPLRLTSGLRAQIR
jgi:hypothetical protein